MKFWIGDTITQFTGQITALALPTVAILTLQVTAFEYGLLGTLEFLPFPILGLFVGVWIDRMRRRPVLILANLIQVVALGTVPVAFVFGTLSLYQLYAVALVMGTTTVFFDVAYQSYLTSLVSKKDVVEGNQKLQASASAAQVVGPSVASGAMQLVGAALSVAGDAVGTLVSALLLVSIGKPEPGPPGGQRHFLNEMKEGIRVITGNKLLWTQAGCTATSNLGSNIYMVAFFLFAYRTLGISQGLIGIAFSIGAVGFLLGVLMTPRLTALLGLGRTVALAVSTNFGILIVLLAGGNLAVPTLGVAFFIGFMGNPIYNINQVSLRQIITPNRLQGRMNATMRTIVWGTLPVGSFLGGIFASSVGIVSTIIIGVVISGGAMLWIVLGPIFKLRRQPEPVED